MIATEWQFYESIQQLFTQIVGYNENRTNGIVQFDVYAGFNAEALFALSDLLKTRTIYVQAEGERDYNGCPTCGDLTTYIHVYATNVLFAPNKLEKQQ